MSTWNAYREAAQAYAAGVRALMAPAAGEGATRGEASADDLAARAAALAPLSTNLTRVTSGLLGHDDPLARAHAAGRLLAKSLTDLQVSAFLLDAGNVQAGAATRGGEGGYGAPDPGEVEENLGLVLADPPEPWPSAAVRGAAPEAGAVEENLGTVLAEAPGPWPLAALREQAITAPDTVDTATRVQLARAIVDTLLVVRDQATRAGQAALGGLMSMGLAQVAQAAGILGLDVATALGQGEPVLRLYAQARDFFLNGYNAILAVLGPVLARTAANQVTAWVAELQTGSQFGKLLDGLYETGKTGATLGQLVTTSRANAAKFTAASEALGALQMQYTQQAGLVDKIARGLVLVGSAPAAVVPNGQLLMAAAFVALAGYIVLAGADFVDAPRLRLIDRVPGVRRVVETDLGPLPTQPAPPVSAAPAPAAPLPPSALPDAPAVQSTAGTSMGPADAGHPSAAALPGVLPDPPGGPVTPPHPGSDAAVPGPQPASPGGTAAPAPGLPPAVPPPASNVPTGSSAPASQLGAPAAAGGPPPHAPAAPAQGQPEPPPGPLPRG